LGACLAASRVAVVAVAIAVVAAAVSGPLYYQATREGEAVRRLGVEVAGVSVARLGPLS
jgi:phage-related minor tail protein